VVIDGHRIGAGVRQGHRDLSSDPAAATGDQSVDAAQLHVWRLYWPGLPPASRPEGDSLGRHEVGVEVRVERGEARSVGRCGAEADVPVGAHQDRTRGG
jgi:hypothetical protein